MRIDPPVSLNKTFARHFPQGTGFIMELPYYNVKTTSFPIERDQGSDTISTIAFVKHEPIEVFMTKEEHLRYIRQAYTCGVLVTLAIYLVIQLLR